MSRKDELFATPYVDLASGGVSADAQARMAKELGADSLRYLPVEAIARSVSLSPERLCRACITGHYPTETGQYLYQIEDNPGGVSARSRGGRAYEPEVIGRTTASNRVQRLLDSHPRIVSAKIGRPSRRYLRSKLVR